MTGRATVSVTAGDLPIAAAQVGSVVRASELLDQDPTRAWLIEGVWGARAVGVVGGPAKAMKTWLVLDAAVAVASNTTFLGVHPVRDPGPVMCFFAEDGEALIKSRVRGICASKGIDLDTLDLFFIRRSRLRIDNSFDFEWLERQVRERRPKFFILDPFVRVFSGDEDDTGHVSRVLGLLRKLEREYGTGIALVHHVRKSAVTTSGQSLRGSGDFFAWADSGVFLTRRDDGTSRVTVEHRGAASPAPFRIRLDCGGGVGTEHLVYEEDGPDDSEGNAPAAELGVRILALLAEVGHPLGLTDVQTRLRAGRTRVADTLRELAAAERIEQDGRGWRLRTVPPSP